MIYEISNDLSYPAEYSYPNAPVSIPLLSCCYLVFNIHDLNYLAASRSRVWLTKEFACLLNLIWHLRTCINHDRETKILRHVVFLLIHFPKTSSVSRLLLFSSATTRRSIDRFSSVKLVMCSCKRLFSVACRANLASMSSRKVLSWRIDKRCCKHMSNIYTFTAIKE